MKKRCDYCCGPFWLGAEAVFRSTVLLRRMRGSLQREALGKHRAIQDWYPPPTRKQQRKLTFSVASKLLREIGGLVSLEKSEPAKVPIPLCWAAKSSTQFVAALSSMCANIEPSAHFI